MQDKASKTIEREPHPTLSELEDIVSLPQSEWLPRLQNLKWRGNERINIEKWKDILRKLKEPIHNIDTTSNNATPTEISLIYAILNIYVTLITHSSRHTMHNFDILSIDSLQKMIDLDDIHILIIVLDVWNVFWHRSGGTMQFEHAELKKKIVGLCHSILQNEFTLAPPQTLQNYTKMSILSTHIPKTHSQAWNAWVNTVKIPKEYTDQNTHIIKKLSFSPQTCNSNQNIRKCVRAELDSLKLQMSLPSEKEFVLKWRMYFAAQCNDVKARQDFVRLRIKALLVLSTFAQQYSSILRDFLSDIDFAELSLELTELVELTHNPHMNNYSTPTSPSPPNHTHSQSPKNPKSPIGDATDVTMSMNVHSVPNDIRISGLLCLKNFVFQVPIPFEQLRSIWDENSFVPATLRSIINDLDHDATSLDTLKFATQFLNFLHSTITRTLPQMVGIHQFLDWESLVQQVITVVSNKGIRECALLKECATLLYVILAKQRKPQTFIQFKGLQLCFELIHRIMDESDGYLTHKIKSEYLEMKCMDVVNSSFTYHMIQQYTQQHLIAKLLESCMQSVRLSREGIPYLKEPLIAQIMKELISKCYTRQKQVFLPSDSFTPKESSMDRNKNTPSNDEDNDTKMDESKQSNGTDNTNKARPFALISNSATPPPPSKRQKNKETIPQFVLPIVPKPTEDYGHEVYQITCKMIAVCIQNGAGLGVGKIFHEYGVTMTFVTSLTKQGVPNRSQVFQIVVECLRAICLHQPALNMITQSGVIECLIRCFANPNYASQLTAEAASFFAKKMEELLRHNAKLKPFGIKAIVRTLKQLRNKPYLELKEMYNSPIYFNDNANVHKKEVFPIDDAAEMALICNATQTKNKDQKDIYPLFPTNAKIRKMLIYPEEPCFTGDNEAFWSAVTNIGKFLETSLKKFTQWEFVKNGGMDALVQLSYDPIMHSVAVMRTKVFKADKKEKHRKNNEEKSEGKMKDVTADINAKFGSLVVPATNPKMTTAQKAVANSYPYIEDTQWPKLINNLLETFKVSEINDQFVQRFHYYSLEDVKGDMALLKRKHHELADALKTGSRITCLFSILTRLMRRADIKIIHKSKFYLFMKCLSDIIPGILWYMSCSDTNSVHDQASKLRKDILGLLSADEKKELHKDSECKESKESVNDDDNDVQMNGEKEKTVHVIKKEVQDQYDGVFINIRYYECQVVSLMNHFTKFFKNALRIYRRSQDGRQRNQFLIRNNQNVVEYMSHMLHILIAFRAPLLLSKDNNEAVFDFWSITQFYEYVCHIVEAMAFTSHKTIVEGLIKSFIKYGGLQRIVEIFRYFVHCLNLTLHPSWNNNTNKEKAYILSLDAKNPSNPLNSIIYGAKLLFIKSEEQNDQDIKIKFCTETLPKKKKKTDSKSEAEEKQKKEEEERSKYGMNGVIENLKSVVIQFYNFLYSLMKAGNVLSVHRDFRRYLAVELATLLKSPWVTLREDNQYFKPTDFALIDKIVDSTHEYISICSAYNIEYPPPEIKEEKQSDKQEQVIAEEESKQTEIKTDEQSQDKDKGKDMDIDQVDESENKDTEQKTETVTVDPARQLAIDQLLQIVPDDRELVVYALDALQESAPNNVSVALEWIFTHQEAWKKKKAAEAQHEKDAAINADDEIKYYFKLIKKKDFGAAIISAFYNEEKEDKSELANMECLGYLKSDTRAYEAPVYWEYYPLFRDVTNELIAPLLGLIDKMPCEDQEKWTFRPMSRPDQVEKLLKRIALLIKTVHKSIGDMKMKCLNKRQIWQEKQSAQYKELQKQKVAELIDAQALRKAEILSKKQIKKEEAERKKKEAELAELEKNKNTESGDNASEESYDEAEELRLAMQMSMMEQSDDSGGGNGDVNEPMQVIAEETEENDNADVAVEEPAPIPIDDGVPAADMEIEDTEEEEQVFENEYFDEDDVEETEEMKKLLIFPEPPTYQQNQTEILVYSISRLLALFKTHKYPNNHAAAYCFAILQDAEPRTISIAQESTLLQTICELIEDCCRNLSDLRAQFVDKDLEEEVYNECKTNMKKYQSLVTTYYIIITGFLNKKAIRTLKENLLEDINRTHPHLYKNVTTQIAKLDKEVSDAKKEEKKSEKIKKDKKKISFEDEEDDDDDVIVEDKDTEKDTKETETDTAETKDKKEESKEETDVVMDAEPKKKSKFEIKKEAQAEKKRVQKLEKDGKRAAQENENKKEFEILYAEINAKCDKIKLEDSHKNDLLRECLKLLNLFTWKPYFNSSNHSVKPKYYLRFQCEPNLLNRILTILESITSEYKYAKMLLNGEGYKCILNCSTTNSSTTNTRISSMATSIIRHMFDEPSLLTDAMIRQIKLSFEHFRKMFTAKQKSTSSPFAGFATNPTPDCAVFTQLFDPYMPLTNFMNSFKTLAARNEHSFCNAVKNICLIVRDTKQNLLISSRELLNKYALLLRTEAKQSGRWESQDPRNFQWMQYTDTDNVRIERVYQEFVNRLINGKLQNFHTIPSSVSVHFDGQAFTVDVREYRQKNASGGSRKIRRRRLNFEEKRKIALQAKKEMEKMLKAKEKMNKDKDKETTDENTEAQTEKKKSDKEEADDDGDVVISDNTNKNETTDTTEEVSKSVSKSHKKSPRGTGPPKVNKYPICAPRLEEHKADEKVLGSFKAPLNALMAIIVQTTGDIKDYCITKRAEMKIDERERRIKQKAELDKKEKEEKEKKAQTQMEIDTEMKIDGFGNDKDDGDIEIKDSEPNTEKVKVKVKVTENELKIDDNDLEEALPSVTAMQTILGGTRLFAIGDMLKILNDIIGNYPKFSSLVLNFNTNVATDTSKYITFVQFMIEELIPYPSPLNETKNVVKPDKSVIASNLLKSIAGLNQDKNQLNDQTATKFVLNTLVKHIIVHSDKLYQLSSFVELEKEPNLVGKGWNPHERMDKKLMKKHENIILEELYQIKSNLEVLRDFVKTPSERFCRFTARILTDSEVIDTICHVLESKFDYGYSKLEVDNDRYTGNTLPHPTELKSDFLNPIAKLLHNICEIDSINPIYNLVKSQRRKSRKRKSMDNTIDNDTSALTAPASPLLESDPMINDGIIRSASDTEVQNGNNRNNLVQFISDISNQMGVSELDNVQFEVEQVVLGDDGMEERNYAVIDFDDGNMNDDEDMVDSQDVNDESIDNTELNEEDEDEDEEDEDEDQDENENENDNDDEQDEVEEDDEDEDEEDEEEYNDENLDRLYGQYAEEENDGFYDDEELADYDEYGEDDIGDEDDDDDVDIPTSVHRIASDFMDDLGAASDDFRQFFLRSQRFANIRRLDTILNGDDTTHHNIGVGSHGNRSGTQAQIHFVNPNQRSGAGGNIASTSVFQIPPFDAGSLININNVPSMQPMIQMVQQHHNALLQQNNANNMIHYPPPPMNVHIPHDLQQRYRLHHANRHGIRRVGADVPQSSSTLFQRAFGDSPEARRPRSLMAIYRLIDRPVTSYFNSSDVQNELYNAGNTTTNRTNAAGNTRRNGQNDIINQFSRIQRFYDAPRRRVGGAALNGNNAVTDREQYRNEQAVLAQNLMRDYVNCNWVGSNQNQLTAQNLNAIEQRFGALVPESAVSNTNTNANPITPNARAAPVFNIDHEVVMDDENEENNNAFMPIVPLTGLVDSNNTEAVQRNEATLNNNAQSLSNITDQVSNLLRTMQPPSGMGMFRGNNNNGNARVSGGNSAAPNIPNPAPVNNNRNVPNVPAVSGGLDALTSQIFGMINTNNNSANANANANANTNSRLEVVTSPNSANAANTNDRNEQSMDVDQSALQPPPAQDVQQSTSGVEQKQNTEDQSGDTNTEEQSSEQKQETTATATATADADANAMEVDNSGDNTANTNTNTNVSASAATEDNSSQAILTRLEREIENNPIWNYSEMLSFDPDVILSLPEIIRNDIIPPEFQNEVGTYLSMYQAQIAQRDIQRRRVEQEQAQAQAQPQPAPVASDKNANEASENKENKESESANAEDINENENANANVATEASEETTETTDTIATETKENKESETDIATDNTDTQNTTDIVMNDSAETNTENTNEQKESEAKQDTTMDVDTNADNTNTNTNTAEETVPTDTVQTLPQRPPPTETNNNSTIDTDAAFARAFAAQLNQQRQPTQPQTNATNTNAANTNANDSNTNNASQPRRIDPSVLAALPPDIQQEILHEQRRLTVTQRVQNNEMDQATALLTVDPQTRREMLSEMHDDNTLVQLPSHLLAEAVMLRNRRGGYGMGRWGFRGSRRGRGRGGYGRSIDSHTQQPTSAWEIAARDRKNTTDDNKNNGTIVPETEDKKEEKKEETKDVKMKDGSPKKRKKRTPEENKAFYIQKLCKESPVNIRNRIFSQYKAPINIVSLNVLLQIMENSEVGHSELVLRGIFARLCKYQRLRLIIFNSLFDQLTLASPTYTSVQETTVNNNENRARLRRSLALIRYLMQSHTTAQYLVKYMQLPTDYEIFVQGTPTKKAKLNASVIVSDDIEMMDKNTNTNQSNKTLENIDDFDMNKCRILTLFSLFGSPMLKNQSILQSFVETLSMLCKSNEMYLTHLQISIDPSDIKFLVSLISDHLRCNDSIFTKLNNIAKAIMNVPNNKRALTSQIIAESHNLSLEISKELATIHKTIFPRQNSEKRGKNSWTITNKQNALLRNIEFLNKLISSSASHKFDESKEREKIKKDSKDESEMEDLLKERREVHKEQLLLLTECSKGMEELWVALDKVLLVFGYVTTKKDISIAKTLKKEMSKAKQSKNKKEEKESKDGSKELPSLANDDTSKKYSGRHTNFTNEEQAMKAKMNQQNKILKKDVDDAEEARITSSVERLKPLIRAFFILHDFYSKTSDLLKEKTPEELHSVLSDNLASPYLKQRYDYFLTFTDEHRNIFNLLIGKKPKLLIGDRNAAFVSLVWHPKRVLDFDNKKLFLRSELKKLREKILFDDLNLSDRARMHTIYPPQHRIRISVRRKQLFSDSFAQIKQWSKRELMNKLSVKFLGEDGVDAGGLTREFYQTLSREMFNPNYSLFLPTNDNKSVFQPNINSGYTNVSHLDDFKFVGLMCAKAIYDEQVLDAYFTRSFLKHILNIAPNWHDLQSLDFQHYKNLKWMLEHPINDVIFERFTYNVSAFGLKQEYELKSNGASIDVTDSNKKEYIKLIGDFKMTKQIQKQIDAFKEGLHILIPHWLISIFTWPELDLLICGMPDIDIKDMMGNTEYHSGLSKNTKQIKWFWAVVNEMDSEERALLLQFITGTSKVPIGGFKALPGMDGIQRLQIHACGSSVNQKFTDNLLPSAHTCFNQLDLPRYSSKEILKNKLLLAIRECSQGFGFS